MKNIKLVLLLFAAFFITGCPGPENDEIYEEMMNESENESQNPPVPEEEQNNPLPGNPDDYYRFTTYQTTTADPFDVNVLFHVADSIYKGVANLSVGDLRITENDEESPIDESKATLFDRNSFELKMRTALLIDISNSIQTDFESLKNELKVLIDAALPYQEIAVYSFSSTTELVQDYSTDKAQLKTAIDNLQLGTSSTDLYGAVVTAANSFENGFEENLVNVGNLIIFTDGDDTQASNTFTAAKEALTNKNAYVVGLSSADLDEDIIRDLFGNSFYFASETIGSVNENFGLIQTEIENFANSVYLLNYETPKRGGDQHFLKIYHKQNINVGTDQIAVGEFTSIGFYEPNAPSMATLISPTRGEEVEIVNQCNVKLKIEMSIDPDRSGNEMIVYQLYFGESPENLELVNQVEVTANTNEVVIDAPSRLQAFTDYYWQIKTLDNDRPEFDTVSEIWDFKFLNSIFIGDDLDIRNQSEIDNFYYNIVQGNLSIVFIDQQSDSEISNLSGLNIVSNITGQLNIQNTQINSLSGIENISNLRDFRLSNNQFLEDIGFFPNVSQLRDFQFISNPLVNDLTPLSKITSMGRMEIRVNDGLTNLNGLENITSLSVNGSDIWWTYITDNINLIDFCALDNPVMENRSATINGNQYNPTWTEIQNGNCKQ